MNILVHGDGNGAGPVVGYGLPEILIMYHISGS